MVASGLDVQPAVTQHSTDSVLWPPALDHGASQQGLAEDAWLRVTCEQDTPMPRVRENVGRGSNVETEGYTWEKSQQYTGLGDVVLEGTLNNTVSQLLWDQECEFKVGKGPYIEQHHLTDHVPQSGEKAAHVHKSS